MAINLRVIRHFARVLNEPDVYANNTFETAIIEK